jgi:hypothetical protein
MANTETVTLRLPSGEEIDAVVPAGLSDSQIRAWTVSKRPDLFVSRGKALPGLAQPANARLPQLSPSEEMPVSQAETDSQQTGAGIGGTLAQLGGPAAAGLAIAGTGAALPALAARTLPPVTEAVKAFGVWAKANPELAGALHTVLKATLYGGTAFKLIKSLPTPEK